MCKRIKPKVCCWFTCSPDETKDPKKEICRLKKNWLFMIMVLGCLNIISSSSMFSSFHQFITNPTEEAINKSLPGMKKVEPGLGESEVFYSSVIAVFNIGAALGAFSSGGLIKFIPYWHMILSSLILHTLGYVLYATATTGWVVMLSKLMSGTFSGAQMTLSLAYISESIAVYDKSLKELGEDDDKKASRIKHRLFAFLSFAYSIGDLLGTGINAIIAQFPINQFRSIGWYNVAVGIAVIVTQVLIFKGEGKCRKNSKRNNSITNRSAETILHHEKSSTSKLFSLSIITFLIISRALFHFRFCVYETLLNPILSDSFGFTERDSSYFFFGIGPGMFVGTLILLIFQQLHLSNRLISVIGLILSIIAYVLLGDWQAMSSDLCTENSIFHHPELQQQYMSLLATPAAHDSASVAKLVACEESNNTLIYLAETDIYIFLNSTNKGRTTSCELVESCPSCMQKELSDFSICPTFLHLRLNDKSDCLSNYHFFDEYKTNKKVLFYFCSMYKSQLTLCLQVSGVFPSNDSVPLKKYVTNVHIQTVQVLERKLAKLAEATCENNPHYSCHWNPQSRLTGKYCEDCPPICRDKTNYLSFYQVLISIAFMFISAHLVLVPMIGIISDKVEKSSQGIVMGIVQVLNTLASSVGPLWLDAAYEGLHKRTFLAMLICIGCNFIILIGILILYPHLGEMTRDKIDYTRDGEKKPILESDGKNENDSMP